MHWGYSNNERDERKIEYQASKKPGGGFKNKTVFCLYNCLMFLVTNVGYLKVRTGF